MRKLAILLLALLTIAAAGKDKHKHKDKRFDPAPVANAREAAGYYVGPDAQHFLELAANGTGAMNGVPLTNIRIDREHFSAATRDGKPVRGMFVNRVMNDDVAFGIILDEPQFELGGGATTSPFYRRR